MSREKRAERRSSRPLVVHEIVDGQRQQCVAINVANGGLLLKRLNMPSRVRQPEQHVGLEFSVPGSDEVIWAMARVCHSRQDEYFHDSGVAIDLMSTVHRELFEAFVASQSARC